MPPSRSLFQSTCRGFVCQSCVSKLLYPRQSWTSRSIRTKTKRQIPRIAHARPSKAAEEGIKYFEETPEGDREEIDFDKNASLVRDLEERISELQGKLEDVKAGKDLEMTAEELDIQQTLSTLTDEERMELLKVVDRVYDAQKKKVLPNHPTYDFDMKCEGLPNAPRLEGFLALLRTTALSNEFTPEQLKTVWKQYSSLRKVLLTIHDQVPTDVWEFLWTVFAKTALTSPERLGRLKVLAQDMEKCKIALSDTQMIIYLEAWYYSGQTNSALDRWRSLISKFGRSDSSVFKEFWELGIRMLSLSGRPQEAVDAAVVLFKDAPLADARIIIPIIGSWVTSNDVQKPEKAWVLYRKLQTALSRTMQLKDYDAVANIFLRGDLPGLALGVFRDMMLAGDDENNQRPSTPRLENFFEDTKGITAADDILAVGHSAGKDINWKPFEALAYLPPKTRNKFFFGKWIKKLLGEGEITAALRVIDLMQKYQVRPAAIQLNGVIGALLRSNTARGHAMGEKIGWDMIKARARFLAAKARIPDLEYPLRPILTAGKNDYLLSVGSTLITPQATQETIALLLENYRRRGLQEYVADLWNVLQTLQLQPTTWILNQLLLAYHRAGDYSRAREIFEVCFNKYRVQPDLDTIKWLWLITKQRRTQDRVGTDQIAIRKLFASTMSLLPPAIILDTEKIVMADIYDTVIQCFGLVDDQIGTAISMRVFYERYGLYPRDKHIQTIVTQLAATDGSIKRPDLYIKVGNAKKQRVGEINALLQGVMDNRAKELAEQGIDINAANQNRKGEERIFVLTELLKSLFEAKVETAEDQEYLTLVVGNPILQAARQMGVPHMKPWETSGPVKWLG